MKDFSYITHSHPSYIEGLYHDFVQNPESVDPDYRKFFEGFDFAMTTGINGNGGAAHGTTTETTVDTTRLAKEFAVYNLILAYRKNGHLVARTNPIRERKDRGARLDLKYYGLTDADLGQSFSAGSFFGMPNATLQQLIDRLKKTYCEHIGVEYQYIVNRDQLEWLQKEIETNLDAPLSLGQKSRILEKLNQGVIF